MHGKGTYKYPAGAVYCGQWKDDVRHGKGELIMPDGYRYAGDYKNDEKHGLGVEEFTRGPIRKFEGEY